MVRQVKVSSNCFGCIVVISFVFCVGEIGHLRVLTIYMENPEIPVGNQN